MQTLFQTHQEVHGEKNTTFIGILQQFIMQFKSRPHVSTRPVQRFTLCDPGYLLEFKKDRPDMRPRKNV